MIPKNKIIVFDTNMWLKLFNESKKENIIDKSYYKELKTNNHFCILNICLIECLMRYKRQKNIHMIRSIIEYIHENNVIIGNISCLFFNPNGIKNLSNLKNNSDEKIYAQIKEWEKNRFEFKSRMITLWILTLIELLFVAFVDSDEERDRAIEYCEGKSEEIKNRLSQYFEKIEENEEHSSKNLLNIVNEIYKDIFFEFSLEFKCNECYLAVKEGLKEVDKKNPSISYIYKGLFKSPIMEYFKKRIDITLDNNFDSQIIKQVFYLRLKAFMQGEALQKNDIEDMLILSTLELDKNIIIVTDDNKMRSFLKDNNYTLGNEICDKLLIK